jgi:hypothetical protein
MISTVSDCCTSTVTVFPDKVFRKKSIVSSENIWTL